MAGLVLLALGGSAPAVELRVGGRERRHRVSAVGLPATELGVLRGATEARLAEVLAVYVGTPAPDRPAVLGAHAVDAEGLHFQPRFPFVPGVLYTARVVLGSTRLEQVFEVSAPEGRPPSVLGVFPSGDTLPENALRLYLHFSQPMETRDAHRRVHLLDDAGHEVPLAFVDIDHGLWDPSRRRLTLLFHPGRVKRGIAPGERLGPPLREGRTYRIVVDAAMADATGRPLEAAFAKTFRVSASDRDPPQAARIRLRAPRRPEEPLVIELPEPLDEALLQRLVWVEDEGGGRVEGDVEIGEGETRWSFRPRRPWTPEGFSAFVHPALEDRAGNRFDRPFDRDLATADESAAVPIRIPFRVGSLEVSWRFLGDP